MDVLVPLAVVVGLVVLLAWPLLKRYQRRRDPRDQDPVTGAAPPPRVPDEPVPGSRPHRRRRGQL
jgi:hypothetical protein